MQLEADAHEKHLQVSFSAPIHDFFEITLSLSLPPHQSLQIVWRRLAKPNQGQTGIPRINHVSERPTLRPMPRKNIIEL